MGKLTESQTSLLIRLYDEQPLTIDKLPYTDEFNKLVADFRSATKTWTTHRRLYNTLMTLRKAGRLLRKTERGRGV